MVEIGEKIKNILKAKGMTIKSLAEQTGYTRQGLSVSLKNGDFKVSSLKKFANVLEVNICDFFNENESANFESEVKYFIEKYNPDYYYKIKNKDNDLIRNTDNFMRQCIRNIFMDMYFGTALEHLNKKNNRNVKITFVSNLLHDAEVTFLENNRIHEIHANGIPLLEKILKKLYHSINQDDIDFVEKQIILNRKKFISFINSSKFLEWYKFHFPTKDEDIQYYIYEIIDIAPKLIDGKKEEDKYSEN